MDFSKIKEILHDSILKSIALDWQSGNATIDFILNERNSLDGKKLRILSDNVSNILIPRFFEWGPSNFVNEIWIDEKNEMKIEMQSGDMITIERCKIFF